MIMKWHNLNIGFRIAINSGVALLLYVPALYLFYKTADGSPTLTSLFPAASVALTAAFGGFLVKRGHNNKIKLAAAKDGLTLEQETAATTPGKEAAND